LDLFDISTIIAAPHNHFYVILTVKSIAPRYRLRNGSLIPEIVKEFIGKHIHSMDVLEILLFLRKESRKEWTANAVSQALTLERSSVQARLDYLLSAGFLNIETVDGERRYLYRTADPKLSEAADELARWFGSHRVSIISLVFSNPSEQVWTYPDNRE
jgi:predicted transcriptional regulator